MSSLEKKNIYTSKIKQDYCKLKKLYNHTKSPLKRETYKNQLEIIVEYYNYFMAEYTDNLLSERSNNITLKQVQ